MTVAVMVREALVTVDRMVLAVVRGGVSVVVRVVVQVTVGSAVTVWVRRMVEVVGGALMVQTLVVTWIDVEVFAERRVDMEV